MRIVTSKMRRILYPVVICLAMLTIIAPINAPTSRTVFARTQQPAYIKTGAFVDVETMLSRIFQFYKADPWLDKGRNGLDARYSLLKPGLSNKLIVPVQEPGKTSVPFKGWITKEGVAKEGTISLVLKIYDQANGGTKLYEGIHEVEVTRGQYFALIQVPSETIGSTATLWLEAASVEERELPLEQRQQFVLRPSGGATTNGIFGAAVCLTCGGSFPIWRGVVPPGTGSLPIEYGTSCSGSLTSRADANPFICSGN